MYLVFDILYVNRIFLNTFLNRKRLWDELKVYLISTSSTCPQVKVGPQSVGYRLEKEGLVFGGSTLTASDIAVATGLTDMGQADRLKNCDLSSDLIKAATDKIHQMVEDSIDCVKVHVYIEYKK